MHAGSSIYVGFGGFDNDVDLPTEFEALFEEQVLTQDADPVEYELDSSDKKYFRQIRNDWSCYGFEIGSFDTAEQIDLANLQREAERWLPYAQQIGKKYGVAMEVKVHILSYMA